MPHFSYCQRKPYRSFFILFPHQLEHNCETTGWETASSQILTALSCIATPGRPIKLWGRLAHPVSAFIPTKALPRTVFPQLLGEMTNALKKDFNWIFITCEVREQFMVSLSFRIFCLIPCKICHQKKFAMAESVLSLVSKSLSFTNQLSRETLYHSKHALCLETKK